MGSLHSITDGDRSLLPKVVDESKKAGEKGSASHDEVYKMDGIIKGRFSNNSDADLIKSHDSIGDLKKLFQSADATPEAIAKAGKKLDDAISPVAPEDMKKDMKDIHAGVLGGDTAKVAEAIKDIKEKHPEMLKDAIKEMNRQFKENNAGVEMALTGDGKVLLYKNDPLDMSGNKSALQIDPKDGSVAARPIKVRDDGTVVLEPGEIVNADVDKIAKGIGNTATGNINGDSLGVAYGEQIPTPSSPKWSSPDIPTPDLPGIHPPDVPNVPEPFYPGRPIHDFPKEPQPLIPGLEDRPDVKPLSNPDFDPSWYKRMSLPTGT